MFSLGQAVSYQRFNNSKKIAAILTGFSSFEAPILTYVNTEGQLIKHDQCHLADVRFVRAKTDKSPTGHSIYYGAFCKNNYVSNVKMKIPEEVELIKELKKIQKYIDAQV
jgi:hypothetical protein